MRPPGPREHSSTGRCSPYPQTHTHTLAASLRQEEARARGTTPGRWHYRSGEDPLKPQVGLLRGAQPDLGGSSCLEVKPPLVLAPGVVGTQHARLPAQEATRTQWVSEVGSGRRARHQSEVLNDQTRKTQQVPERSEAVSSHRLNHFSTRRPCSARTLRPLPSAKAAAGQAELFSDPNSPLVRGGGQGARGRAQPRDRRMVLPAPGRFSQGWLVRLMPCPSSQIAPANSWALGGRFPEAE